MSHLSFFRAGARYTVREPAGTFRVPGKGDFPQRFEQGAFDGSIGTTVPLKVAGQVIGHVLVVAADVADDGSSVLFTYEVTDLTPGQPGDISIPG